MILAMHPAPFIKVIRTYYLSDGRIQRDYWIRDHCPNCGLVHAETTHDRPGFNWTCQCGRENRIWFGS